MAEDRGFIVAAVTGYHANATGVGGWNVPYAMVQVPRPPAPAGRCAFHRRPSEPAPAITPKTYHQPVTCERRNITVRQRLAHR